MMLPEYVRSPRLKAPSNQEGADGTLTNRTPSAHRGYPDQEPLSIEKGDLAGPPTVRPRQVLSSAHALAYPDPEWVRVVDHGDGRITVTCPALLWSA